MGLFQKSVLEKYLKQLDDIKVREAYQKFQAYFHNPDRQANIRAAKEEQFQEGFLRELFVNILGYTINPEPDYNLTTEFKDEKGAKKADGAILVDGKALGVIELKGTDTKDLDKINDQAFSYKNNQSSCVYVITSNFEKLRFFIDNAVEHEEFNLFKLTKEEFKLLWLCLQKDNLLSGIPQKIKEESLLEEEKVTKRLYDDYSVFKRELWQSMVQRNSGYDELLLFKKSQKLLDRFLFILFSEDKGLLPPNSISEIVKQWQNLKELDEYRPLYDRYKKFFGYMNRGFKGKKYEIHAYNGGLFCEDVVLNSVVIDDKVLRKYTMKLTEYDFNTEVDVNILGHIFEHSLSEIENVQAQLEGKEIDKSKSKRKKDGIFYTPRYITKYIVDNTVGKLCEEKKVALGITDERFTEAGRRTKKGIKDLEDYREWMLRLTICDPACGSGAFLNQALEFLINEHTWLDELVAEYHSSKIVFPDVEKHILENNLYGVDINEESIEIAKLSLWLRTAKPGRRLTTLSDNIKCGNSLIDDPSVAGDKAFNWEKEFPKIFQEGGFDIVIGNPPYVNVELIPTNEKNFYKLHYKSFYKRSDLFSLFLDVSTSKLSKNGRISFIVPSIVLNNLSYSLIRERLLSHNWLAEVCYTGNKVFKDATIDTTILIIDKGNRHDEINLVNAIEFFEASEQKVPLDYFTKYDNNISIGQGDANTITDKLFREEFSTAEEFFQIFQGVVTGNNDTFIFEDANEAKEKGIDTELLKPMCHGRDISKWHISNRSRLLLYLDNSVNINHYPSTLKWLTKFEKLLSNSKSSSERSSDWFCLHRPRVKSELETIPKILVQNTRNERLKPRIVATIDEEGLFGTQGLNFIISKSDISIYSFLGLLNSKLMNYLFTTKFLNLAIKADYLKKIKFPKSLKTIGIEEQSKVMSNLKKEHFELTINFQNLLISKFDFERFSKKLQNWHELEYKEFLKELKKVKIQLNLYEESEWMQYFNEQKKKATELKQQISVIDKEIDQMVYELYGLTGEEIEIVENH